VVTPSTCSARWLGTFGCRKLSAVRSASIVAMLVLGPAGCGRTSLDRSFEPAASDPVPDDPDEAVVDADDVAGDPSPDEALMPRDDDDEEPSPADHCAPGAPPPLLTACVRSNLAVQHEPLDAGLSWWSLAVAGQVIGRGSGERGDCLSSDTAFGIRGGAITNGSEGRWIRVRSDEGEDAIVGIRAAGIAHFAEIGEDVSIGFHRVPGWFRGDVGWLEVRGADGSLRLWAAFDGSTGDLMTPAELAVRKAEVACVGTDACARAWTRWSMAVTAGKETQTIPYGEQRMVGGYVVMHGGLDTPTSAATCDGESVALAGVAAWRPR
jgi:hypothetical protein